MRISKSLLRYLHTAVEAAPRPRRPVNSNCPFTRPALQPRLPLNRSIRRFAHAPADDPDFLSIVDNPPKLVRSNRKHTASVLILVLIPITAFALGTWQVFRLGWKTELIARFEDRLVRDPLPLPPHIDPSAVKDFDYRRVYARGRFRHDQEMLVGPRVHEGEDGYNVITPLERGEGASKVLVSRGWIARRFKRQEDRREGLPEGEVVVAGLLREPFRKNMFTPDNAPEKGEWYFPDVEEMARASGSQAVWVEETMRPDLMIAFDRAAKGIPLGRLAEVNLRNNHTQYIFTWYALSLATTVMLYMVLKKPQSRFTARVRQNREW